MRFSEVISSMTGSEGQWTANAGEDWLQGRTLFGGLQAAICVRAMRALAPAGLPLRTLQVTFIAPIPAGTQSVRARLIRSGKSATHVEASLFDGDQLACAVIGIFGARRESSIAIEPVAEPLPPGGDQAPELPYLAGIVPVFTQHIAFRWLEGGFPFSGAARAKTRIAVRLRDEAVITESEVIALADSIPTPAISMLKKPAAASSLTWTLEFLSHEFPSDPAGWWRMDAEVTSASGGYINQSATLWSPEGRAVALSRQSVVVFA